MPLSWNEIRHRAIAFSKEWAGSRVRRRKSSLLDEFFNVFGIRRRVVASFEEPVKNLGAAGKDLGKAESQAFRHILVSRSSLTRTKWVERIEFFKYRKPRA